ncbi:hypothetical protein IFR05_013840 [Cadophora sp. M221]|nr:hypothetical protein IFR05_013840 [Cadophora sp. M221]
MDLSDDYLSPRSRPKPWSGYGYGYGCSLTTAPFNNASALEISQINTLDSGDLDEPLGNSYQFDYTKYQAIEDTAISPSSNQRVALPHKKTVDNNRNTNQISSISNPHLFPDRNDVSFHNGEYDSEPVRENMEDFAFSSGNNDIDNFSNSYDTARYLLYPSNEQLYNMSSSKCQADQEHSRTDFGNTGGAFEGDRDLSLSSRRFNGEIMEDGSPRSRKPKNGYYEVGASGQMGQRQELIISPTPTLEPSMVPAPPRKRPSSKKSHPVIASQVSQPPTEPNNEKKRMYRGP